MEFAGKTAIVTGGSRGIGRAVVEKLRSLGATVHFTYSRSEEQARALEEACGAHAHRCEQCDLALIEKTVEKIVAEAGRIDVLVNNAGITSDQYIMMMSLDDWLKVVDTNLNGAFRWAKAVCRPMMTARSGAIVNIASVAGMVGIAGQTNYAASKGGLIAFTRSLAAELGPKGVRVNCVVPGYVETDMTAKMPRQFRRTSLERVLLKRFGKPEEIAEVVAFLSSEAASYVAAQVIVADGGLTGAVA